MAAKNASRKDAGGDCGLLFQREGGTRGRMQVEANKEQNSGSGLGSLLETGRQGNFLILKEET